MKATPITIQSLLVTPVLEGAVLSVIDNEQDVLDFYLSINEMEALQVMIKNALTLYSEWDT